MNVLQFKKKSKETSANISYSSGEIQTLPKEVSAIGIDLGTTNSVVSVFSYGATHPVTLKYVAELDANNFATFYEYDEEGSLVRVKKETEKGIMTIQETKNHTKR